MQRTPTVSQLCSLNSSSFCLTPFQLWPPLLNSSQAISALLNFATLFNSSQSCSISSHLSSTLFTSSLLFPTLLKDSHLCPPGLNSSSAHLVSTLLNSSQLFSPLATSSTLPTSSHLRSTHLTSFSAHLNSSHLGHLFSTLHLLSQRCLHTEQAFAHSKLLHTASSYTEKLLHTEAFTHSKLLHAAIFRTEKLLQILQQAFTQRSFYSKLSHREAFTQSKLSHREAFAQSKLLHREAFTQSKLSDTANL